MVAPAPADLVDLAQTLARSGASGLLLVPPQGGDGRDAPAAGARDTLADLGAAAADAGLPAIRVHGLDPATLERRLIGFLVDRRGELERQSSVLEADLAQLAMAGRGVEALTAAIGGFLRRAVALEGRRSDTIALHAPADVPDAAAAVSAYLARPLSGGKRVPLPGAPGETAPSGWLVLLGDRPVSDLETIATERVAPLLSLELLVESQVRKARDESPRTRRAAVRRSAVGGARRSPAGVRPGRADARGDPPGAAVPVRRPPALAARHEREPRPPRDRRARARRPAGPADRGSRRGAPWPHGRHLGAVRRGRPVVPSQEAAARATLDAAERLAEPPRGRALGPAGRLSAARSSLGTLPDDRLQATALLDPLLTGRPASVRERLATLRAVLDHGAAGEAAARLGIHRNTLAYRVRNLEARTGWDLGDPELRLALSVAVRIVQSAQQSRT